MARSRALQAILCSLLIVGSGLAAPASSDDLNEEFTQAASCVGAAASDADLSAEHRIMIAGHAYGHHAVQHEGVYPTLAGVIKSMRPFAEQLVLTGDVTLGGSRADFEYVVAETRGWDLLVVPGNHDVADRDAFEDVFNPAYGSAWYGEDLLIWLDTDLNDWRIEGPQLEWLQKLLENDAQRADNLVVFTHHLIWSAGDGLDFPVNGGPRGLDGHNPSQLRDLLAPLKGHVLVVSGDVGAFRDRPALACVTSGNVTYIASGLGGGRQDNFLLMTLGTEIGLRICMLRQAGECVGVEQFVLPGKLASER